MKNNNWKDNWFGAWLDVDIVTEDNTVLQFKRNQERKKNKYGEATIKNSCKKYIQSKEDA